VLGRSTVVILFALLFLIAISAVFFGFIGYYNRVSLSNELRLWAALMCGLAAPARAEERYSAGVGKGGSTPPLPTPDLATCKHLRRHGIYQPEKSSRLWKSGNWQFIDGKGFWASHWWEQQPPDESGLLLPLPLSYAACLSSSATAVSTFAERSQDKHGLPSL
jgi:hypothetical protein